MPFNLYMIIYNKYSVVSFKNVMFATFIKLQSSTIILKVKSKLFYFKLVNIYSVYINDIFKIPGNLCLDICIPFKSHSDISEQFRNIEDRHFQRKITL